MQLTTIPNRMQVWLSDLYRTITFFFSIVTISILATAPANALFIASDFEVLRISAVGATFQSLTTQNSYTTPVVVCTYNLPSNADNEAVVRLDNVAGSGFDIRIQRPENSSAVTASDVYCLIAEEGLHTLPDGRQFEAHTVLSDGTNGQVRRWGVGGVNGAEDVSAAIVGTYPAASQPAVLGQVMTFNDPEFSAFWSFDCDNRQFVPFQTNLADGICVGKHVGQISGTSSDRANETLGYIVIEQGTVPTGNFGGINYRADLGADSILGAGNTPPYTYALTTQFEFAVATKEAEDGGQGGWAVLYGTDPLAGSVLDLAIDEETVQGDTSRTHISEQVAYWVFRGVDHSDAPASYGDASHNVNGLLSLGFIATGTITDADAESAAQSSANADGDDTTDLDDEEGVVFRSPPGTNDSIFADVTVNNLTGGSVSVCAWLDIPAGAVVDGSFDASDGQCQTTAATNPTLTFQWSSLPTDQAYTTFARFRVSTATMTTANVSGLFIDGEVEDYQVVFDFTPTFVTIGNIDLEYTQISDFLEGLDIEKMTDSELLQLLEAWNPAQAAILDSSANRGALLQALRDYLDPDGDGLVAILSWDTLEERGTIGFYAERSVNGNDWQRINDDLLPGLITAPFGGDYRLLDPKAHAGQSYQYRLIELEANGNTRQYGPYTL